MDFIINELSAKKQFASIDDLVSQGLNPLISILATIRKYGFKNFLKNSNFWNVQLIPGKSFSDLCFSPESRLNDGLRKIKSQIASLQNAPFWDLCSLQNENTTYYLIDQYNSKTLVNNSGIAEAFERQGCLISFCRGDFDYELLSVEASLNQTNKIRDVPNIWNEEVLVDVLFKKNILDIPQFIKEKFSQKLDFSEASEAYGLNLINSENFSNFTKSFGEFERMTWQQIITSDAFDYKEFNKNKKTRDYFSNSQWNLGIHKFRIDRKFRCFGYVADKVFHVLRIDLDHDLSDKG